MGGHIFTDQLHRKILLPYPPQRIISLVPSQTELLFDLGLENEIVGITKFCIHPADKTKLKLKIGGTKKLRIEQIRQLKPDLIIGNKEENEKSQIGCLMEEFPVWMSDICTLGDALDMINQIGIITGREQKAQDISARIKKEFNSLSHNSTSQASSVLRIAYFIWKDPYMVAAAGTFINNIIELSGWQNAFSASRYPQISAEQLKEADPDLIFLSSEPYPFKEKHIQEFKLICPDRPVVVVDGELFSWYGSRLQYAPAYIRNLKRQIKLSSY
jgi:ABC-type Fe3+-hydroxamate transport system substrate-binding protein